LIITIFLLVVKNNKNKKLNKTKKNKTYINLLNNKNKKLFTISKKYTTTLKLCKKIEVK